MSENDVFSYVEEMQKRIKDLKLERDNIKHVEIRLPYDLAKIRWRSAEGKKGPFEVAENDGGEDLMRLLRMVKDNGGGMDSRDYRFWVMPDGSTVARRARK